MKLNAAFACALLVACTPRPKTSPPTASVAPDFKQADASPPSTQPDPALAFDTVFGREPQRSRTDDQGLQIVDYTLGSGDAANVGSRVSVYFVGYLQDGTIFDERREPLPPFRLNLTDRPQTPAWSPGLQGMKPGGKRKIVVPPELGYGEQGDPGEGGEPDVPPNATLTYVVHLLEIEPPPPESVPAQAFEGKPVEKKRLPNGLVVEDHKLGTGESAARGDEVAVYFRSYLPDGKIISAAQNASIPFRVVLGNANLPPGWSQGLVGMREGGLRKLTVPAELAFGSKGAGPVPPDATLTFTIQLLKVVKAPPKKAVSSSTGEQANKVPQTQGER